MHKKKIQSNNTRRVAFKAAPAVRTSVTFGEIASRERSLDFFLSPGMPLPNPDPVLKKMGKDITAYKDLRSDAWVGGCADSRAAGVLSLDWAVDRGTTPGRAAAFCQSILKDPKLDMYSMCEEMLDAPQFGYQPMEVIWQMGADNLLRPVSVKKKPCHAFAFDASSRLMFRSRENPMGEQLPPRKFLLATRKASWENPYGEPVLGSVFWPAVFKKAGFKFWATFIEKYGMPHIIGKTPRNMGDNETSDLLWKLEQMVQDAVAVIPDDSSVEVKDYAASGGSVDAFERFLGYCDKSISIAELGQTLTTDVGDKGSLAAGKVHMQVRGDIVTGDKKIVEATVNQLLTWTCELNFPGEPVPMFSMYAPEDVDKDLAERDKVLTECGVRFTPAYFQREYGLKPSDFNLVEVTATVNAAPLAPGAQPAAFSAKAETAGAAAADPAAAAVDALKPAELQAQAEGLLKPVIALVKTGVSYDEVLAKLPALFPDLNDAALIKMLERAIFVSDLLAAVQSDKK